MGRLVSFFAMMGIWSLVFFCACIALALWLINVVIPLGRLIRGLLDVLIAGVIVWWALHLFAIAG